MTQDGKKELTREERRALALRENLRRRKEQSKARATTTPDKTPGEDDKPATSGKA